MKLRTLAPRIATLQPRVRTLPAPSKANGHRITGRALGELRKRIWLRDRGICAECGLPCLGEYEVDHRIPLEQGGTHDDANLAIVHIDCHQAKTKRER